MDTLSPSVDFRPRSRQLVMGGVPWLPRITDKARAKLRGTIGDYIYPCPADRKFLEKLGITADEFTAIIASTSTDQEVVAKVRPIWEKSRAAQG
jgi:hypothetical protein